MKDSSIKEELEMWRGHGVVIASLTNEEKSKYIQEKGTREDILCIFYKEGRHRKKYGLSFGCTEIFVRWEKCQRS